jgi:hypothetical protein
MPKDTIKLSRNAVQRLGHYVYAYVDPLTDAVLYIGKGHGSRALSHLRVGTKSEIGRAIRKLRSQGREPRIDIIAHNLPSERVALIVEAAAIDLIGIHNLSNAVRGHKSMEIGRAPLSQLLAKYASKRQVITVPSLLIRINKLYHFGITEQELYDATRSTWKAGPDRDRAKYAFAIFDGIVKEVYSITKWLPAGTTYNTLYHGRGRTRPGRWEFVGTVADEAVRRKYKDKWVGHYFAKGAANPIQYVKVKST